MRPAKPWQPSETAIAGVNASATGAAGRAEVEAHVSRAVTGPVPVSATTIERLALPVRGEGIATVATALVV